MDSGDACLSLRPLSLSLFLSLVRSLRIARPGAPYLPPAASSPSVHVRLAGLTRPSAGSAMAVVSLMPRNFFHPVWLGRPPTQASRGPGRRPESRPGYLSAGLAPARPPWTPVPPAPAPWRPKPQGGGGGGEVAARRRAVPARRALRAGFSTHRARGARGPGAAECVPDPRDPEPAGPPRPRRPREVRTSLSLAPDAHAAPPLPA